MNFNRYKKDIEIFVYKPNLLIQNKKVKDFRISERTYPRAIEIDQEQKPLYQLNVLLSDI